jgi:hypothetical protein
MNPPFDPSQEGTCNRLLETKLPSSEGLGVGSSTVRRSERNKGLSMNRE